MPLIMLVDDDRDFLEMNRGVLEAQGFQVRCFTNADRAWQSVRERRPELVITDLGMPHMDGRELAGGIKKLDNRVPVILLSGWGLQADPEDGSPDFVDRVLNKPPRMDELREAILEVFESSQKAGA